MPTDRPTITAPVNGTQLPLPASVAFDWTGVAGAAQYGFEFTGADRQFTNPNGTHRQWKCLRRDRLPHPVGTGPP